MTFWSTPAFAAGGPSLKVTEAVAEVDVGVISIVAPFGDGFGA